MLSSSQVFLPCLHKVKSHEVAARAMTAYQRGEITMRARPLISRPLTRDALGIMSSLRLCDWCLDVANLTPGIYV